jgi:hypothetical protein
MLRIDKKTNLSQYRDNYRRRILIGQNSRNCNQIQSKNNTKKMPVHQKKKLWFNKSERRNLLPHGFGHDAAQRTCRNGRKTNY